MRKRMKTKKKSGIVLWGGGEDRNKRVRNFDQGKQSKMSSLAMI